MFIGATRTGIPLFCVTFSLRFLCLVFCRIVLSRPSFTSCTETNEADVINYYLLVFIK